MPDTVSFIEAQEFILGHALGEGLRLVDRRQNIAQSAFIVPGH
jgi:hypothetical protein